MSEINWGIDLGDLRNEADGPRLCGCTPYEDFRIEKGPRWADRRNVHGAEGEWRDVHRPQPASDVGGCRGVV